MRSHLFRQQLRLITGGRKHAAETVNVPITARRFRSCTIASWPLWRSPLHRGASSVFMSTSERVFGGPSGAPHRTSSHVSFPSQNRAYRAWRALALYLNSSALQELRAVVLRLQTIALGFALDKKIERSLPVLGNSRDENKFWAGSLVDTGDLQNSESEPLSLIISSRVEVDL